jgi:tRNA threonylcarbamoyladenosine biosynthesis protein TsaE
MRGSRMKKFQTFSPEETIAVGIKLGKLLKSGDIVCLKGELGTGKTAFTNGIASALGINDYITSPTFTIINEYMAEIPLYHFDVYRIADPDEMFDIGFEEYINGDGIVVIEWASLIRDILPPDYILVDIRKNLSEGIDARIISVDFKGDRYREAEGRF